MSQTIRLWEKVRAEAGRRGQGGAERRAGIRDRGVNSDASNNKPFLSSNRWCSLAEPSHQKRNKKAQPEGEGQPHVGLLMM